MTLLRRSRDGRMVHRTGCVRASNTSVPWVWAEGKNRAQVKAAEVYGLQFCKVCKPLEIVPK